MKTYVTILAITIACALAQWLLPWWVIVPVTFAVSLLAEQRPGRAFVTGFCGVALWWLIVALYRDIPNNHILSLRMAQLLHLSGYDFFIILSVLIGGLTGGLSAAAAAFINPKR